jgi:hypothetical protein
MEEDSSTFGTEGNSFAAGTSGNTRRYLCGHNQKNSLRSKDSEGGHVNERREIHETFDDRAQNLVDNDTFLNTPVLLAFKNRCG